MQRGGRHHRQGADEKTILSARHGGLHHQLGAPAVQRNEASRQGERGWRGILFITLLLSDARRHGESQGEDGSL